MPCGRKVVLAFLSCVLFAGPNTLVSQAQERQELSPRVRESDNPLARQQWFMRGRTVAHGSAAEYRLRAYEQKLQMRALQRMQANRTDLLPRVLPSPAWTSLGPSPLNSDWTGFGSQDYGTVGGRITAVAVDPNDTTGNTVYIGAAYGGVWKTTNGTATPASVTWTPIVDSQATLAVDAIAIQPGNSNIVLVGTGEPNFAIDSYYGLGILRSIDGGITWNLITQTSDAVPAPFHGYGISKIAFSTDSPSLVVAATNSAGVGASFGAITSSAARGIVYSTDAGTTWRTASFNDGGITVSPIQSVTDIVFNSVAHKFFAVMRLHGIYSSTDGITWTRLAAQPGTALTALACPASTSSYCPLFRGQLATHPTRNELYFWYVDNNIAEGGIYQSTDSGATWNKIYTTELDTGCGDGSSCGVAQGFYNLYLAAVPDGTATDLYAGAINIYKCQISATNPDCKSAPAGTNWLNLTHVYSCNPASAMAHVHPDQHAADFSRTNPSIIYFGNDGGIYRTLNGPGLNNGTCSGVPNPFDNLNSRLGSTLQFYTLAGGPTDPTQFVGGTQDNGSPGVDSAHAGTNGVTWSEVMGGDGGAVAIDPTSANKWYVSNTGGPYIYFSSSGVTSRYAQFNNATPIITSSNVGGDYGDWVTPFKLDPADPTKIIIGTCRVWRGPSSGVGWTSANALSNNLGTNTSAACGGDALSQLATIRTLAVGGPHTASGSQVIYAGSEYGHVFATTSADAGPSAWIDSTVSNIGSCWTGSTSYPCGYPISGLAIDPSDSTGHSVYATVMGFGVPHVLKSIDGGHNWTNISGNLPDSPADSVAVDPDNPAIVYVGTDVGVFATSNGGTTWTEYGTGFPNTEVVALDIFSSGSNHLLRAATHGRGVWSTTLASGSVAPAITKSFGATTVLLNGTTTLTFTISNPSGSAALTGVSFTDTLPSGLVVATPNGLVGSCGAGTITAIAGSGSVTLTGATIAAAGSCQFTVNVTGTSAGTKTNTVTVSSTNGGTGNTSTATLAVASSTFSGCQAAILGGLALHDKTANAPFADPTPLTPGHAVDGIQNSWTVGSSGLLINSTGTSEPVADLLIFDATGAAGTGFCFNPGNVITVSFNGVITSPAVGTSVSQVNNMDVFDSSGIGGLGIISATVSMAFAGNTVQTLITITVGARGSSGSTPFFPSDAAVGGTSGAALRIKNLKFDATSLSAGVNAISVNVAQGASMVGVVNAGTMTSQNTVATKVAGLVRPSITTAFGAGTVPLWGSTSLTFTINNNNTSTTLNGVAFWDTLPSGLVVATPNGLTGSCGGGTVTAPAGSNAIFLSGATMAPMTACTISVNVTATTAGLKNNSVQVLSTTTGWGNTATASLTVPLTPPYFGMMFGSFDTPSIALNATETLSFTIQNPNPGDAITGVGFTDNLPAGLVVANPTGLSSNCGGSVMAIAGSGSISLSSGSVPAYTYCSILLNVQGTSAGLKTNTTSILTTANAGTAPAVTKTIYVSPPPPTIAKAFGASTIPLNGSTTLTFTVTNDPALRQDNIAFTDTMPAGLIVATPNGLSTSGCTYGTINAIAGSGTVSLTGGYGFSTCTITVNVQGITSGTKNNSVTISSRQGGTGNTATASLTVPPNTSPIGYLDQAINQANGTTTIPQSGTLYVSGWAVDQEDKAPITKVEVKIDGSVVGNATLGGSRPDIATLFGSSAYTNAGWTFSYNIGSLAPGNHTVSAVAYDSIGATTVVTNTPTITVPNTSPIGYLDQAINQTNGTTTIPQSGTLYVSGWAVDQEDKAPLTKVEIRIDGSVVGNATLGGSRPDIATLFGSSAYTNAGWTFSYNIGTLSPGNHTVSAVAYDSLSATTVVTNTPTITVPNTLPIGYLDQAINQTNGTTTIPQSGTMYVSGWAVDQEDKAPITKVEIKIDGSVVGNATLGGSRPDIATLFGSSAYTNAGWTFSYNIGSLAPGNHTVSALAYDSLGATTVATNTPTITVPNTPPIGYLDVAINQANGTTTIPQSGTLYVSGWAVDQQDKAPITKVEIRIDGSVVGNATLGGSRPDIATLFGSSAYTNAGWTFSYNIGTLAAGLHTISAVAYDSLGATTILTSTPTITVPNTAPIGYLDVALNQADGTTTIPQSGTMYVSGWAVDQEDKAPITKVEIRIDGSVVGNATLGIARADIATLFGSSAYTNAGWTFSYNIGSLATGGHTISAVAYDSLGATTVLTNTPNIAVSP